jgi:DNA polymerase-3 subunit epsilon
MIWNHLKKRLGLAPNSESNYAEFYQTYLSNFQKTDSKKAIRQQSFVVLDTETTGLDLQKDNIISIGAVRVIDNSINIADSLSIIVKNQQAQIPSAVTIHGLVQIASKGQDVVESITQLLAYIGSDIIVGHHAAFDIAMINKMSQQLGGGTLKNPVLDTAFLAKRLDHVSDPHSLDKREYTLDKLCTRYNVVPKARHTADGDAYITAMIFMKELHQFSKKGINTIGQLLK